jgi:hypothetical protein
VPFVGNGSYEAISDFQLASGAVTALDAGAPVPAAVSDAQGMCRPDSGGAFDAGALERNAVSCTEAVAPPDTDGDGVPDSIDDCPTVPDPAQLDADVDGVGDACDSCLGLANPRVTPDPVTFLANNPWATLTGGQRDDDHDGYGNRCDAKFSGTGVVGSGDLAQFRTANNRSRAAHVCGTTGLRPCAIFDLDEANPVIGGGDVAVFRSLTNKLPGPKCAACPLPCASGTAGSCGP